MNYKHGMRGSRIYGVWSEIKARCSRPSHPAYKWYGGRGITLCESWKDFKNFLADMGNAPDGLQIDRVDNNKGYSPDNCKWVTRKEQCNNRRNNRFITIGEETMTLSQWADRSGVDSRLIEKRIGKLNWSESKAINTPPRRFHAHI